MSITLSVGVTTVELDPDLLWVDENSWYPVEQTVDRSINGALIISVAARIGGRPITLQAEDDASAWVSASDLVQQRAWAAIPGQAMQLVLRGVTRTVIFRHQDTPLEAVPVAHYRDVEGGDWYRTTYRFTEI